MARSYDRVIRILRQCEWDDDGDKTAFVTIEVPRKVWPELKAMIEEKEGSQDHVD